MVFFSKKKRVGIINLVTGWGGRKGEKAEVTRGLQNSRWNRCNCWWRQHCVDRLTTRGSKHIFNAVNPQLYYSCAVLFNITKNTLGIGVSAGLNSRLQQRLWKTDLPSGPLWHEMESIQLYTRSLFNFEKKTTTHNYLNSRTINRLVNWNGILLPRLNCLPFIAGTIPPVLPWETCVMECWLFPDGHFIMLSVQTKGESVKNAIKTKHFFFFFIIIWRVRTAVPQTRGSLLFLLRRRQWNAWPILPLFPLPAASFLLRASSAHEPRKPQSATQTLMSLQCKLLHVLRHQITLGGPTKGFPSTPASVVGGLLFDLLTPSHFATRYEVIVWHRHAGPVSWKECFEGLKMWGGLDETRSPGSVAVDLLHPLTSTWWCFPRRGGWTLNSSHYFKGPCYKRWHVWLRDWVYAEMGQ